MCTISPPYIPGENPPQPIKKMKRGEYFKLRALKEDRQFSPWEPGQGIPSYWNLCPPTWGEKSKILNDPNNFAVTSPAAAIKIITIVWFHYRKGNKDGCEAAAPLNKYQEQNSTTDVNSRENCITVVESARDKSWDDLWVCRDKWSDSGEYFNWTCLLGWTPFRVWTLRRAANHVSSRNS